MAETTENTDFDLHDLLAFRRRVRSGHIVGLSDSELRHLAAHIRAPVRPSDCVEWMNEEAMPMLRELARRMKPSAPIMGREVITQRHNGQLGSSSQKTEEGGKGMKA